MHEVTVGWVANNHGYPYRATCSCGWQSNTYAADHAAQNMGDAHISLPVGITSDSPMPYNYRRWNGEVWCDAWVDHYNQQLTRAIDTHRAGYDATNEVDALYRMASQYDALERESNNATV